MSETTKKVRSQVGSGKKIEGEMTDEQKVNFVRQLVENASTGGKDTTIAVSSDLAAKLGYERRDYYPDFEDDLKLLYHRQNVIVYEDRKLEGGSYSLSHT